MKRTTITTGFLLFLSIVSACADDAAMVPFDEENDEETSEEGDASGDEGESEEGDESGAEDSDSEEEVNLYPSCDDLQDPGLETKPIIGAPVNHLKGFDHNGDPFSLCDLAGKPAIIDISFWGCGPCEAWAEWLGSSEPAPDADNYFGGAEGAKFLKDRLADGTLQWVTVLTMGVEPPGGAMMTITPVTVEDAKKWHEAFPAENAIVMAPTLPEGAEDLLTWADTYWDVYYNPFFAGVTAHFTWATFDIDWEQGGKEFLQEHVGYEG